MRKALCLVWIAIFAVAASASGERTGNPHGDGFDLECITCHTTEAWTPLLKPLLFSHDKTGFPLTDAHVETPCRACHQSLVFHFVGTACADCHPDAHAGELGFACDHCHTPSSWEDQRSISDIHSQTLFALLAPHASLPCESCHSHQNPWEFASTPTECDDCHLADYRSTTNPNHVTSGFSTQCLDCHSPVAARWEDAVIEHPASFPLRGAHRIDCESCHANGFAGTPTACYACHSADYQRAENHKEAGFSTECQICHNDESWEGTNFNHDLTSFPLGGAHRPLDCDSCHSAGFAGTPTDCYSCHRTDYQGAPDHSGFSTECQLCHNDTGWEGAVFDHNQTFPLRGAHGSLDCDSCHSKGFAGTPRQCVGCHRADYNQTKDPNHVAAGFSTECQNCHGETSWEGANFDHNQTFPLRGAHGSLDCDSCHSKGFAGTPTQCVGCHRADYNQAKDPNHVAAGFPTECQNCHGETSWEGADFDHNQTFPLRGAHGSLVCDSCHSKGFAGTPRQCVGCHRADYNQTQDPNHVAAGFPTECQNCHGETSWEGADFDHNQTFPLRGAHGSLDCDSCHSKGFAGTPRQCVGCHRADYNQTQDPNHVAAGFPTECQNCHSETTWEGADFDHNQTFPLRGAHGSLDCDSCHSKGFSGTPRQCVGCHRADYNQTQDPNHVAAGFPTECQNCHSETTWEGANFDHNQTFPLRGAHGSLDCDSCHSKGFSGTPRQCVGCHRADYNQVKDPNHVAAGFPTECQTCHNETTWEGAQFDHAQTSFPLLGAHRPLDCDSCHANGFAGTPRQCVGCHRTDYNQTRDPNHVTAGFPTECQVCHNQNSWDGAEFNHNTTAFPLRASHAGLDCKSCHAAGYSGTPTDCYSCHATDYDRANDPNHRAAGFPTTCELCHEPTRWQESNWDHDSLFPIYSGSHRRAWSDCSDCHVSAASFTVFECIFCHEHSRSRTDNEHDEVRNYRYESRACLNCHPDGRE